MCGYYCTARNNRLSRCRRKILEMIRRSCLRLDGCATAGRAGALLIRDYTRGHLMDHDMVVRQKMTERYLLDELDPAARDEFEEHYFDCKECALDVRAGALFVEQSKFVLAEKAEPVVARLPATASVQAVPRWLTWFRPAVVLPLMALLLTVIGFQY